jgi:hypoxanthine phosphoribosyltransferase
MAEPQVIGVLFSEAQIQARVRELGAAISRDYSTRTPHLVGVLRGVVPFMADLVRAITIPLTLDFIAISRYGPSSRTRGVVHFIKDLDEAIAGRHVIFVEDVVDTGLTLNYILQTLERRYPASLQVCTLFDRSVRRLINDLPIAYRGFELPDQFVVGYGLDYGQHYRNLPYVGVLNPDTVQEGARPLL